MTPTVGFLGLGIMGSRMAANVSRAGFPLTVWNRTAATAESFAAEHGATAASTPAEAAAASDVVISIVVDAAQTETVLLGPDGAAAGAHPGLTCVDMATIGPDAARSIGQQLAERGIPFLDAPVTGSAPKAADGTLTIMAGGESAAFARVLPVLESMGELIVHVGPGGHGQLVKVINQALAAINSLAVAEALLVGQRAGVSLDALVQVVSAGSGGSTVLALKSGAMRDHTFEPPLFKLDHLLKDVRLCLAAAEGAGADFELAERARAVLEEASNDGLGEQDFAALVVPLERSAGIKLAS